MTHEQHDWRLRLLASGPLGQALAAVMGIDLGSPVPATPEAVTGTGTEPPSALPEWVGHGEISRTFAFVDLAGFTSYTEANGAHAAIELLAVLRAAVRDISARRGVRVAKWLGDGAMIVGVDPTPTIATVVELSARAEAAGLRLSAGVATGPVLLFEGDDYIGRAVNMAARLCDHADHGAVLCDEASLSGLPDWVTATPVTRVRLRGLDKIGPISSLRMAEGVELPPSPALTNQATGSARAGDQSR